MIGITHPILWISGDDVHVAADEGEDLAGGCAGVLNDEVSAAFDVGDVVDDEGSAAGGGGVGEEGVEHVAGDPVLLGDEIRWVVLYVFGFSDDLREERDE